MILFSDAIFFTFFRRQKLSCLWTNFWKKYNIVFWIISLVALS